MSNFQIAMEKMREFQAIIFDRDTSPNKLLQRSNEVMRYIEKGSTETMQYQNQVNAMLNTLVSKGMLNQDLINALTNAGISKDALEKISELQ